MPHPIHFEFQVDDPDRATKFYQTMFGWQIQKWGGPVDYWVIITGKAPEPGIDGGFMRRKPGAENMMATYNTIGVPNLDEAIVKAKKSGGTEAAPKMPIPGVGWLAYFKDTEGNIFGMMQADKNAK